MNKDVDSQFKKTYLKECSKCTSNKVRGIKIAERTFWYCEEHWPVESKPSKDVDTEAEIEKLLTTNIEHDGSYIPVSAIRKKIPEIVKLLPIRSEADIRIDERVKCTLELYDEDPKDRQLFNNIGNKHRERISELKLEAGTADTTGLASDKPSVRKENKFEKGK